jgi:hypothetical protein
MSHRNGTHEPSPEPSIDTLRSALSRIYGIARNRPYRDPFAELTAIEGIAGKALGESYVASPPEKP